MAEIFSSINASTPNSVARAIANEVVAGKNAIASALVTKGQPVTNVDTFNTMSNKILAITGEVNVTPLQNIPSDWHDLAQVIASNTLADYPYSFAILLAKNMKSIQLTGSNRYITSDGGFYSGDQMHTFDTSKDNSSSDTYATFSGILCGMSSSVTIKANQVGSVGNIKLTGNGTSINSLISSWNAANPAKQVSLTTGDGTQIPLSGFYGLVAGMTTAVEICQNAGGDWGQITLVANGTSNIASLISTWNTANPTKQITLKSGVDTQVPTANIILKTENIQLTGGSIGNSGKSTRWVIFCNNSDNVACSYNFTSIYNAEGITATRKLLQLYIRGVKMQNINISGMYVRDLFFDTSVALNFTTDNITSLASNYITSLKFQGVENLYFSASGIIPSTGSVPVQSIEFSEGTKRIYINTSTVIQSPSIVSIKFPSTLQEFYATGQDSISTLSNLQELIFPSGIKIISFAGGLSAMQGYTNCVKIIIPDSIESLIFTSGGAGTLNSPTNLSYMYIGCPKTSFGDTSAKLNGATSLTNIALGANWNWTFTIGTSPIALGLLTHDCLVAMLASLVDYRADGITTPTITANGTTAITGVNTQFTKVHHAGETIYINGVAKAINSIIDDTHMVMTATVTSGSGLSYGSNKTLTIGSLHTAKLTAAELLVGTNKGWTIA